MDQSREEKEGRLWVQKELVYFLLNGKNGRWRDPKQSVKKGSATSKGRTREAPDFKMR